MFKAFDGSSLAESHNMWGRFKANKTSNIVNLPLTMSKIFFATNFEYCRGENKAPITYFGWDDIGANNKDSICLLTSDVTNLDNYQCYYALGYISN